MRIVERMVVRRDGTVEMLRQMTETERLQMLAYGEGLIASACEKREQEKSA